MKRAEKLDAAIATAWKLYQLTLAQVHTMERLVHALVRERVLSELPPGKRTIHAVETSMAQRLAALKRSA